MENTKALISREAEYRIKIRNLRKKLFNKEIELEKTVYEYAALESSIKNFYKNYYLNKLGSYIVLLENLKKKVLGLKNSTDELKNEEKTESVKINEVAVKKIYRKLAKLYHPDNFKNLDDDEKVFYEFRMSEINNAFEKRDLKTLERIERKSEIELDISGRSAVERIKSMEDDIYITTEMISMYKEKKKLLSKDEIAVLMSKKPDEREKILEEIKERYVSEIKIYQRICSRLGY